MDIQVNVHNTCFTRTILDMQSNSSDFDAEPRAKILPLGQSFQRESNAMAHCFQDFSSKQHTVQTYSEGLPTFIQ